MSEAAAPRRRGRHRLRRRVYELLEPTFETPWDRFVHLGLMSLVVVNVAAVVLASVPSVEARFGGLFAVIEAVSVTVFTTEYALRLWSCVEHMPYADRSPWSSRLAWMRTPGAIIDLLAVLPFLLLWLVPGDLRVLAVVRLLRFFKLARYSSGLVSLFEVIYAERRALLATLMILASLVLAMATLMHLAEEEAQPDCFGTIPDAMWWAVVTLTTVGYGDAVPVTPLGKIIAGLAAIMGLALLAVPVGIIATAFSEVIHRRQFVVTWSMVAKVPLFVGLDAGSVAEVMDLLHSRTVPKGELVVRRGGRPEAIYFIVSGEVEVEIKDDRHPHLHAGDFFGEMAILSDQRHVASVRACTETLLLVLDMHDLERLMDRMPEVAAQIRSVATDRAAANAG